ncbi:chemotaxis protein CheA [Phenylobacterium montanum]|uniref:Chemotaxis protein CheA n=1 Tax=Phenylobacterium montanum TaxID=2823693 RepID=A0A975FZV0_9CAUL|nr:chemotaxis protein CheA [Caulobacter sp. S6]QUD87999.1 chemotaxis protein CheA [Caulobacter sp. S6]
MDELEEIKATFFMECEELLADLENGLSAMESGSADGETINAVFRAVHSVKGGAGAFGLDPLVRFAHVFETLMDDIRSGKVQATAVLVRELLRAADILADHVQAAKGGFVADEERSAEMARILEALSFDGQAAAGAAPAAPAPTPIAFTPAPAPAVGGDDDIGAGFKPMTISLPTFDEPAPAAPAEPWKVTFRPKAELYRNANDPLLLLRELERLGPITVEIDDSGLPALEEMEPEGAYLAFTVTLDAPVEENTIRDVFEFVDGDCDVEISGGVAAPAFDLAALLAAADAVEPLAAPQAAAPIIEAAAPPASEPAPAPVPEFTGTLANAIKAPAQQQPTKAAPEAQATIRVDPERIDRLIDLVGELVINQAMLAQRVIESGLASSSGVALGLDELEQLTRQIQDGVMAIRAQSVKSVFQRMPRLVREVANMTGKQVRLVTEGESTEVDKTVIERLGEPITHMLRNAIDHGLETPEERKAAGKPLEGTVKLVALHRGGRIVIEVSDDGKGINRKRVHSIAIEKGLISPEAVLTDEEIDNLIFLPGFSTASTVSDISGRGVGMDVVRRSVQALGGRISISSRPGEGSTFTMSLPLTLAVLDGMVVDVAGQTLVIPLTAIVESLRPKPEEVKGLGPQGAVLSVRDTFVPLVDIGNALGYRAEKRAPTEGVVLLIEVEDGGRAALVADAIQGQRQVVIKSLESNYRQVEGIAAATILGDGRVALIVDVDALVAMRKRETARSSEPTLIAAE